MCTNPGSGLSLCRFGLLALCACFGLVCCPPQVPMIGRRPKTPEETGLPLGSYEHHHRMLQEQRRQEYNSMPGIKVAALVLVVLRVKSTEAQSCHTQKKKEVPVKGLNFFVKKSRFTPPPFFSCQLAWSRSLGVYMSYMLYELLCRMYDLLKIFLYGSTALRKTLLW